MIFRAYQLDIFEKFPRLDPDSMLRELRRRGVRGLERVRYKENRLRLVSVAADARVLHVHACFAEAPPAILDAIARFVSSPAGTAEFRRAIDELREWPAARRALEQARSHDGATRVPAAARCCGSPAQQEFLAALYHRLNTRHFGAALPAALPLRFSARMSRRYGHVLYYRDASGARHVTELALNIALLRKGNDGILLDTMLHEMAHVEAWLQHGHRYHGRVWKQICLRIGCIPAACTHSRMRRVRGTVDRVPSLPAL